MSTDKNYPSFRWWQFLKKRQWNKKLSNFTAGPTIKLAKPVPLNGTTRITIHADWRKYD
jgi:hypothetical protein